MCEDEMPRLDIQGDCLMSSNTSNYSFILPAVNSAVDQDLWGGELNTNFTSLDSLLYTATNAVPRSVTTTDSATTADRNKILLCDATIAAFSETLPAAATAGSGFKLFIKKTDATTNAVTIDGNGSETIDGVLTYVLTTQYQVVLLICDGTGWQVGGTNTNVIPATTSAAGIVQLATNAETAAGSNSAHAVVPSALKFAFTNAQSLTANGYQTLPGGLIIQWGKFNAGTTTQTFALAFPNACFAVANVLELNGLSNVPGFYNFTTTGFSITSAAVAMRWIAVGWQMTTKSQLQEIQIVPGVMPYTDATASDIPCYAAAYGIRFDPNTGRPRKIGGWMSSTFNYGNVISGTVRTIYSAVINQKVYTIIGTNTYLYSLIGSELINITPLSTSSVAAANSLATNYGTLTNNPIATVLGSNSITITDASYARFRVNDTYTLSGATTTNGVPNTELNAAHVIRSIGVGTVTFRTATSATSSGSGGGASVVRSDGLINLAKAAHGLLDGYRIKISGAANTGGILAASINKEFIIRNVTTNTFDVMTAGTSTAAVTAGGGAATVYYQQIAAGNINQGLGQGYGAGLYGVGLYGTALVSSSGITFPRIWFCDRYGDNIVVTPGNQSGVYSWGGNTDVAPALVSGAPININYAFVSDNILVTFGHDVENEIFASDVGDITQWTASSSNQVYQNTIQGAGQFISHAPVDGYNLIYTGQQTYTMKYIGLPNVWEVLVLDPAIGIIAPMARCSVNGIAYWMGKENFHYFNGGKVQTLPSNFGVKSSIWSYVFSDLNYSQAFKIFAWHNEEWDEIWWHYPSANSNECDRVARFSRQLGTWVTDNMNRTAGEYPDINLSNPHTANMSTLYIQESGADADGAPLPFSFTTKKYASGTDTMIQANFIPDFLMSGTVELEVRTYNYPQSQTAMNDNSYAITGSTELVPMQVNGRYYDMTISGDELGQTFLMGQCLSDLQSAARAK